MAKLEISGVTADLVLDMTSWEAIEEEVGRLDDFDEMLESRQRLRYIRQIVSIMAAEGNRLGRGEPMPADWIKENAKPYHGRMMSTAIKLAVVEGMRMESNKDAESGDVVVDAALSEIEKKGQKDG